jgi:cytoskeleton protein RodZ
MIQQYVDFYSEEDPPISSTSNMVPELSATDARIKWTTYLVIVVLAVLLGAWWWNKQQNEQVPISLDTQTPKGESEAAAPPPVVDSNIQAGSEGSGAGEAAPMQAAEPEPAAETAVETRQAVVPQAGSGAAEPVDINAEAEEQTEPEPEPQPAAAMAEETPANAAAGAQAETAAPAAAPAAQAIEAEPAAGSRSQPVRIAPTGNDKLRIIVNADTWADVKDANNYQLLYDLLRAGNTVELSGEAPFAVFLGNGYGVEILFNGEEIGFSSRIRNDNTARINIGG